MQKQVLPHERHSEVSFQGEHVHLQAWEQSAKASAFCRKSKPRAATSLDCHLQQIFTLLLFRRFGLQKTFYPPNILLYRWVILRLYIRSTAQLSSLPEAGDSVRMAGKKIVAIWIKL